MIKKISYIDFWKEIVGTPERISEINDEKFYTNSSRYPKNLSQGIGLFHIENLEKITGYKLELSSPKDSDLIVCSIFGNEKDKYPSKKKIYCIFEPQFVKTETNANTLTFSSQLSLQENSFYLPLYICYYGFDIYSLTRPSLSKEEFNQKRDCLSIISNTNSIDRNNILNYLSSYISIDHYGKLFKNKSDKVIEDSCWFDPRLKSKISQYKFMICFENEVKLGYHTEKIMNAFRSGVIPIYLGDPNCIQIFNSDAYININLLGIENSKNKILELLNNYELYNKMLEEPIFSKTGILNSPEYKKYTDENTFHQTIKKFIN